MYVNVRSVGVGRVWDCMMCICANEEGWDGESVDTRVNISVVIPTKIR